MVPHRGTNWAALRLTAQIGRDAVLSESYGRGYQVCMESPCMLYLCNLAKPVTNPMKADRSCIYHFLSFWYTFLVLAAMS